MIVLDTNVVSEPLKPQPDTAVQDWLDGQIREDLYLTVTSLTELRMGVALLPRSKRREQLDERLRDAVALYFGPRILAATIDVASHHAEIVARARTKGVSIDFADAQIAAIAKVHGFAVATRDVEPFRAAGVEVINPWTA